MNENLARLYRMRKLYGKLIALLFIIYMITGCQNSEQNWVISTLDDVEAQVKQAAERDIPQPFAVPRSVHTDGSISWVDRKDWTSGFFPAILWQMYEYTGSDEWKTHAVNWTSGLEENQFNDESHDLGFMMYLPYGAAWELTGKEKYADITLQSAKTLVTRYSPETGMIRSWDFSPGDKDWLYPVIIDNMMNLELLFWAAKYSGDQQFYDIAVSHAEKTIEYHIRDDGSSYHVVDLDPSDGSVRWRGTHQGLNDESSWARGQAWGLYGFTMAYRETKREDFLKTAIVIADYFISNLSDDMIPFWDFSDPSIPEAPKDVSAGTIAASALIELSYFTDENSAHYLNTAMDILKTLAEDYMPDIGNNQNFILTESTGNMPRQHEVEVPIIYADFYFIEGLKRLRDVELQN
jgi:unsaturated chondroitin disaccharide hydrolase